MNELEDIKTSIGVDTPFGGKEVGLGFEGLVPNAYKIYSNMNSDWDKKREEAGLIPKSR